MMIAPAEPLRLPTVCGLPARSNAPPEAMVRAVVAGRLLPLPSSSSVPAEIFVGPPVGARAAQVQRAGADLGQGDRAGGVLDHAAEGAAGVVGADGERAEAAAAVVDRAASGASPR